MRMTIDQAILTIKNAIRFTYDDIYEEAFDMAIDTMHKYQKVEQIYSDYLKYMNPDNLADRIGEVLEDGKID